MTGIKLALASLLCLGLAACSDDDPGPPPFAATDPTESPSKTSGSSGASKTSKTSKSTTTTPAASATSTATVAAGTVSCSGTTEPTVQVEAVSSGAVAAPLGGRLPDGTWLLKSVKRVSPSLGETGAWHGKLQIAGNRIAWDDNGTCVQGTYTTVATQLTITVESDDALDGDTETLDFTADGSSITLNRSTDEEYDYGP